MWRESRVGLNRLRALMFCDCVGTRELPREFPESVFANHRYYGLGGGVPRGLGVGTGLGGVGVGVGLQVCRM